MTLRSRVAHSYRLATGAAGELSFQQASKVEPDAPSEALKAQALRGGVVLLTAGPQPPRANSPGLPCSHLSGNSMQEARLVGIQSAPKTGRESSASPQTSSKKQTTLGSGGTNRHKRRMNSMKAKGQRAKGRTDPRGNTYFRQQILKEMIVKELQRPPLCPISNPPPGPSSFACPIFPMPDHFCLSTLIGNLVQVTICLPQGTSSQGHLSG